MSEQFKSFWSQISDKIMIPVIGFLLAAQFFQSKEVSDKLNLLLQKDASREVLIDRIIKVQEDHENRIRSLEKQNDVKGN